MGSILAANLSVWPARLPRVTDAAPEHLRVDGGSPWPVLQVRDGDRWLPVHSRRDPLREAERVVAAQDLGRSNTVFVIGFGLGYLADVLEHQGWTGTLVALEPDAGSVRACLQRRDWTRWLESGRLTIVAGTDFDGLEATIPLLDPDQADPVVVVNPVIARWRPAFVEDAMRRAARAWFGARANQDARRRMAGRYLLNTLRNAPGIAASGDVRALDGCFTGVPAILVAAGPSLDVNLPEIRRWRDRAVVVAVDTALRPLLRAGVEPDLVVAVDPGESNARHLVDLPSCDAVHLVAEGSLDPEAMRTFDDRRFIFAVSDHHPWPWLRTQGIERGRLRAWGSVLTTAFDLALRMGCDPIVFTGADLAFTDGRPYARGTTFEEDWHREQTWGGSLEASWGTRLAEWPDTREPGVGDRPVRTAPHLVAFRDWLVAEAKRAAGRTIVNATGHGILRGDGVRIGALADTLAGSPAAVPRRRERIAAAWAANPKTGRWSPARVEPDVEQAWERFASVPPSRLHAALDLAVTPAVAEVAAGEDALAELADVPPLTPVAGEPAGGGNGRPGLNPADAAYLDALSMTHDLRLVPLRDAEQDLTIELRAAMEEATPSRAIVIVDERDTAVGAQVRRAVNAVLCERPDVWLDYRRFVDRSSRLSILRFDPEARAPKGDDIDAPKWQPGHADAADSLVPLLMRATSPGSVVDVGCGAGYWLRAFARHGVGHGVGLTPRTGGDPVHPGVKAVDPIEFTRGLPSCPPGPSARYDLCLALEVAPQLPPSAHESIVAACARLSDTVAFSFRLPGAPEMTPYARPLVYWSDLFWNHGYLLSDDLRGRIEERWNFPRTVFDGLLLFRRALSPQEVRDAGWRRRQRAMVERLETLYEQSIWWAVRSFTLEPKPEVPRPRLRIPVRWWTIPAWRLMGEVGSLRRLQFRTDAARFYLTDARSALEVREDDRLLGRADSLDALHADQAGGWVLVGDELLLKSSDGSDPRTNQRCYAVRLPAFVAWAEAQPLAVCLDRQL